MANESLVLDILLKDGASRGVKSIAAASAEAAGSLKELSSRLKDVSGKTAQARVDLEGDKEAEHNLDVIEAKMATLDRRVATGKLRLDGVARARADISGLELQLDKLTAKDAFAGLEAETVQAATGFDKLKASVTGLAGGGVSPIGALVAGLVALTPVAITAGLGLGGLGLAAAGAAKPIIAAAQATGGLKANLDTLDPAQRQVAKSLLDLQGTFKTFQQSLEPVLLKDFDSALGLVKPLLAGIQPIAKATGNALASLFTQLNATFKSTQWQQFFQFMQQNVAPDIQQLSSLIVTLTQNLPGLAEALQPAANGILQLTNDAAKAIAPISALIKDINASTDVTFGIVHAIDNSAVAFTNLIPGAKSVNDWLTKVQQSLTGSGNAAASSAKSTTLVVDSATALAQATGNLIRPLNTAGAGIGVLAQHSTEAASAQRAMAGAVDATTSSLLKGLTPLENYINATLTQRNDEASLKTALQASGDQIGLKTQKQRDSFGAAQTYLKDTLAQASAAVTAHKGTDQEISSLSTAIGVLSNVKGQTAEYRGELALLKTMLDRIRAEKNITKYVTVITRDVSQGGLNKPAGSQEFHAAGITRVGGTGNRDTVHAMLTPGEAIVPKRLAPLVAPWLKSHGVPGFASGGLVQRAGEALHDVRAHPGHPREQQRLGASLATTRGHISADRELLRVGHLNAEEARHTTAALRGELAHQASLLHQLRPLRRERAQVADAAGDLSRHDAALRTAIADADRRHLTGVARHLRGELDTGQAHQKQLTNWLNKVQIEAAAKAKRKQAQQAQQAAAAAAAATAAAAAAAVQANTDTITSYLTTFEPGLSGTSLNAAEAAFGVPGVQKFDQGGLLKPGLTLALNATGRPEPVLPAGRGGGNTYNLNITVGAGTHPAEAGRQIVAHIREFEKRSGSSWRN